MAYMDFSQTALLSASEVPFIAAPTTESAELSSLEWRVLDLARHDGMATLRRPRKRSWWMRMAFGPGPAAAILANPRLEALRRLAVEAWHEGYAVSLGAVFGAEAAGFSEAQISTAVNAVAMRRMKQQRFAA